MSKRKASSISRSKRQSPLSAPPAPDPGSSSRLGDNASARRMGSPLPSPGQSFDLPIRLKAPINTLGPRHRLAPPITPPLCAVDVVELDISIALAHLSTSIQDVTFDLDASALALRSRAQSDTLCGRQHPSSCPATFAAPPTRPREPFQFLLLPGEVRNEIYKALLPSHTRRIRTPPRFFKDNFSMPPPIITIVRGRYAWHNFPIPHLARTNREIVNEFFDTVLCVATLNIESTPSLSDSPITRLLARGREAHP